MPDVRAAMWLKRALREKKRRAKRSQTTLYCKGSGKAAFLKLRLFVKEALDCRGVTSAVMTRVKSQSRNTASALRELRKLEPVNLLLKEVAFLYEAEATKDNVSSPINYARLADFILADVFRMVTRRIPLLGSGGP
jgi:hypothetical protein